MNNDKDSGLKNIEANLETLRVWATSHDTPPTHNLGLRVVYFLSRLDPPSFAKLLYKLAVVGNGVSNLYSPNSPLSGAFQIPLGGIPQIELPSWARGRVFEGVSSPETMDLLTLHQTSRERRYSPRDDDSLSKYMESVPRRYVREVELLTCSSPIKVAHDDPINHCLHMGVIAWILNNMDFLPPLLVEFLNQYQKVLWSWSDAVFDDDGKIHVPLYRYGDRGILDDIDWSLTVNKPTSRYRSATLVSLSCEWIV